jgi:hypothetical protein
LTAKLNKAEADWHETQPVKPTPVVVHELPDDVLQTGESLNLGGAMQIKAPWLDQ